MDILIDRHQGPPPSENEIIQRMREEGLTPHGWSNAPGDTYGWHEHGYQKVLYGVRGRIVSRTAAGDIEPGPGRQDGLPAAHRARGHGRRAGRALHRSAPPARLEPG
jgi:hypothetical protein